MAGAQERARNRYKIPSAGVRVQLEIVRDFSGRDVYRFRKAWRSSCETFSCFICSRGVQIRSFRFNGNIVRSLRVTTCKRASSKSTRFPRFRLRNTKRSRSSAISCRDRVRVFKMLLWFAFHFALNLMLAKRNVLQQTVAFNVDL